MNGFALNVYKEKPSWKKMVDPILLGHTRDWLIGYAPFWQSKFGETLREIASTNSAFMARLDANAKKGQ